VELHGNLSQNARSRNLSSFSSGETPTLVATDIAARGIHVDDVALVIHADPPVEHKAYLHRSGRTARAGASGTVVTMMLDAQVHDVRDLTRKAGIRPTITRVTVGDALLTSIAPGERHYAAARTSAPQATSQAPSRGGRGRDRTAPGSSRRSGRGGGAATAGGRANRGTNRPSKPGNRGQGSGGEHSAASFSSSARGHR
jgi:superfamily II DNA/RNA helicase